MDSFPEGVAMDCFAEFCQVLAVGFAIRSMVTGSRVVIVYVYRVNQLTGVLDKPEQYRVVKFQFHLEPAFQSSNIVRTWRSTACTAFSITPFAADVPVG